jgi:cytochrome c554/c'-like protein
VKGYKSGANHHREVMSVKICRRLASSVVVLALICSGSVLAADQPGFGVVPYPDNTANLDKGIAVPGQNPFFPSRAGTDGHLVTPQSFDSIQVCSGCHMDIFTQWKGSMHSNSWTDPVYRAALNLMSQSSKGKVDNFCMGCHTPVGVVTKEASPAGTKMSEPSVQGIHCEVCHNVSGLSGVGNGSYVLTPKLHGRPLKFGPYKDAVSPYHDTAYSQLHTQSEFCADCHDVTHPFNRLQIERTYTEWRDSTYAGDGVQCQDCHMKPVSGRASQLGKDRDKVYTHYFIGGNALVTQLLGSDMHANRTEDMLKSAATMQIMPPAKLSATHTNQIQVRVNNVGAGHKLPSGFPEGREVWIDFKVLDAHNNEVYHLGAVKEGKTEPGTKSFKVTLGDKNGNPVEVNVLQADRVLTDTRINPHGYGDVTYMFDLPKGVAGPVKVVAELNYWSFSQALLNELMGAKAPKAHVTHMTTATVTVPVASQVAESTPAAPAPPRVAKSTTPVPLAAR